MSGNVLIAVFDRDENLLAAAAAARRHGLIIVDAYAPYAVHGLDRAIGLPPSRLPWVCFLLGLTGASTAILLQFWTSAMDWPINVGGKPWNSWPAFVPVMFEVTVLLAGVGTVLAFSWRSGLTPARRPTLTDLRVTDDRFALALAPAAGAFDRAAIDALLAPFHPIEIQERTE